MIRLFIAVNIPDDAIEALTSVQHQLQQRLGDEALRWSRPEGMHLTLKFLGDTDPERVEALVSTLAPVIGYHTPFTLGIEGLGCFPNLRHPNVLWAGISDREKRLQALAAAVDTALFGLGWERERRPFTGHLTLARVKKNANSQQRRQIGDVMHALNRNQHLSRMPVNTVQLMRSHLQPQGAHYTELATMTLGTKERDTP